MDGWPEKLAQRRKFERRTDQATQARIDSEFSKALDLCFHVLCVDSDFSQVVLHQTGENRHAKNQGSGMRKLSGSFMRSSLGGFHHGGAAARMNREHLHIEACRRGNSFGDGVRNIMKFQVQKNRGARAADLSDDVRARAGK